MIFISQAANIKTQATKDSVQSAITSAKEKLKAYQSMPKNGLIIFCGAEISTDLEPFKPVQSKLYKCDNRFHTECLDYLLEDDKKFGFVIVDATGALFATVQGNDSTTLHELSVELPKKHGKGGMSA